MAEDPRTTKTGGEGNTPPPDNSKPSDAPGGVGTGTKNDPAENRPSQPAPSSPSTESDPRR